MIPQISALSKWSMMVGNLFEHYDNALFGLLSPFIAPLFFPEQDPLTALILTYCIIPLGMIARPIGSLVFGYIGDTRGRRKALVLTLSGMAIVTTLMGLMPTYQQAGLLAPFLLALGRLLQNFFAAGETIGGAIYLIENTPEPYKNIMSSLYSASTVAGILLASLGVSILCALDVIQDCWRLLYVFGCSTALCAVLLRMKIVWKSPFLTASPPSSFKSALKSCWNSRYAVITIAIASGFSYACYTVPLVMINGLVPLVSSISKMEMMHLNTLMLGVDFLLLPLFGILANRFSREKMMITSAALAGVAGCSLFWFLQGASHFTIVLIWLILIIIGVWFSAPFYSWTQNLVPHSYRYTTISFAYAIGTQLLGGPTAAISLWLFQKTNWIISAGCYWMFLGLLASYFIAKQKAFAGKREEVSLQES